MKRVVEGHRRAITPNRIHNTEANDDKKTPKPTSSSIATMLQMSHRRHLDFLV